MQIHALSFAQKAALFAATMVVILPDAAHAAAVGVPPLLAQTMEFTKIYDGLKGLKKLFMGIAGLACLAFLIAAVISHQRGDSDEVKKRLIGVVLCGGSVAIVDGIYKFFGFSEVTTI